MATMRTKQTLKVVDQDLLRSVLGSRLPEARAAAVRVLLHWHKQIPTALNLLAEAVEDSAHQVRREAVTALGQFENAEAIGVATRVLNKPADLNLDFDLFLYEQGEATLKASLRTRGSYTSLPEY